MGGGNLEVFKFGMYILFPISMMYYFGTNLDNRFSVPDFWPKPEETNRLPYDRQEIKEELDRLKARRLALRAQRLAAEGQGIDMTSTDHQRTQQQNPRPEILQATTLTQPLKPEMSMNSREGSWSSLFGWRKG